MYLKSVDNPYKTPNLMQIKRHCTRLDNTAKYLKSRLAKCTHAADIGSGTGYFAAKMWSGTDVEVAMYEPSKGLMRELGNFTVGIRDRRIINGVFNGAPVGYYDIVTALGCHYLFNDHTQTLTEIHRSIRNGGIFYMDGNVFNNMKGFVDDRFLCDKEKYRKNRLISYWWSPELLIKQLERFFTVVDVTEKNYSGSLVRGYFCRKDVT
jgi:SAM-dependent methyltransferase